MKKNPIILIILATILGLVTSCATDELVNPNPANPTPGQQVTITATLGNNDNATPGTRMDYETDGTGLKTTWAAGDAFNIVPVEYREKKHQTFTLPKGTDDGVSAGAGTTSGTFTGTAPEVGTTYNVYHPKSITTSELFDTFSYIGQVQTKDDPRGHLTDKHSIRLTGLTSYNTITFNTPTAQSSCMKFVLALPAPTGITPTKITLASADGSTCFYGNNSGSHTTARLELGLSGFAATTNDANTITAYMMMSCKDVTLPEAGIIVTVTTADGSNYTRTITAPPVDGEPVVLEGGKTHTITVGDITSWTYPSTTTTYTNDTQASTFLYTADGTATKAGTATNPYLIQSAADLKMVQEITNDANAAATYKDKCYKLTTDITIALPNGTSWTPIGTNYNIFFQGTFDGDGHNIKGVFINTNQQYAGFFGYIATKGTVKNLNVTGNITSTYNGEGYVGGIVGNLNGSSYAIGCSYSGSITGTQFPASIGGICGNVYNSYVIGCYNTSTVKSTHMNSSFCGGIAGYNDSYSIIGCYNTGAVTGTSGTIVGGIVANNQAKVMGCYNTGIVTGTNANNASCGGILGRSVQNVTTGCLWVKSDASGTAVKGIGESSDGTSYAGTDIDPFASIATLNSADNIGILNAAIDTWNSDANGGGGNTASPKYCHYKFKAGTDTAATPPTLTTETP